MEASTAVVVIYSILYTYYYYIFFYISGCVILFIFQTFMFRTVCGARFTKDGNECLNVVLLPFIKGNLGLFIHISSLNCNCSVILILLFHLSYSILAYFHVRFLDFFRSPCVFFPSIHCLIFTDLMCRCVCTSRICDN